MRRHLPIFTSLSFLRLKSPDIVWYQWRYPLILCVIAQITYWGLPEKPNILGIGGIVASVNGLLNMLIGFYIAALAAVASFPSKTLDAIMKGRPPKLLQIRGGEEQEETLTRRRFLCTLFGYCAFVSICIYCMGIITGFLWPSLLLSKIFVDLQVLIKFVWLTFYFCSLSSLFTATLLGLHYLIERIHRE